MGPFETEQEARTAAHAIVPPSPGWSILSDTQSREMLAEVCRRSGVDLGAYDERILTWLTRFEDSACAVIAGLITRAHEAGKREGEQKS